MKKTVMNISRNILERSKKPFKPSFAEASEARRVFTAEQCRSIRASAGILFSIFLLTAPLSAGPYCIDKQEHSLECLCNCDIIAGRHCIDCNHLQDARPLTIITPSFAKASSYAKATKDRSEGTATPAAKTYISKDPQDILNKLAVRYLQNK